MSFQVSPGVEVKEIDLTNVIPAVSTSIGGFAGYFKWGPVNEVTLVSSEKQMLQQFGKPDSSELYADPFFQAASFLSYGDALKVVRAGSSDSFSNAVDAEADSPADGVWIPNQEYFEDIFTAPAEGTEGTFAAKYPGSLGNGLKVVTLNDTLFNAIDSEVSATFSATSVASPDTTPLVGDKIYVNDVYVGNVKTVSGDSPADDYAIEVTNSNYDFTEVTDVTYDGQIVLFNGEEVQYSGTITIGSSDYTIATVVDSRATAAELAAFNSFDNAPEENQLHVAVIDVAGNFGEAGALVEKFADLSIKKTAKTSQGATNYIKNVINAQSKYVYLIKGDTTDFEVANFSGEYKLSGGVEATTEDKLDSDVVTALDFLGDVETEDVNLLFSQIMPTGALLQNYVHQMAYTRKDAVAFLSPMKSATVGNISPLDDVLEFAKGTGTDSITKRDNDGSYGVMDSGAVYIYDRYNDVYRYIPANGHIAGLCANTDDVAEPWFSPAGYNRGGLRGVVKLAFNPQQAQRDELYKAGINPIVSQPGQGIILFGDKTAQAKPSAFDRINVRRLFIVLEKAIATAAKYQLFELNDEFTRASFRNAVQPFLRDIKGRRGLYDYAVICDESNNTGEVIDTNRFVADIYIKPARSINFITLNFVATRTGVDFSEIAGLSNA